VAFDNLKRRGSELNLVEFKRRGIEFVHGDIRSCGDFEDLAGSFDVFIEASAEPSVHAGQTGSPDYLLDTNLFGTRNALDFARRRCGQMIFLSTSRVYSIEPLQQIVMSKGATRFEVGDAQTQPGVSSKGITENFAVDKPRSLYGMTKLASEYLIQEYAFSFGLPALMNRCGVIAGPGQFGKVDQGVFTLWVANHHFGKPLRYTGFGGEGHQVRDLLHPKDLFSLVQKQIEALASKKYVGEVFNVGGGPASGSVSMRELTALCEEATGRKVEIGTHPDTARVDIPWYISDNSKVAKTFDWQPHFKAKDIVGDIAEWFRKEEATLAPLFA
jgi:CDP-paratose 2-epimerase